MPATLEAPARIETTDRAFSSSLIGQRLIEAGYLSEPQLRAALEFQSDSGLLLGEVCMLKGYITYDQLRECLPPLRARIGEKLLAQGLISIEQLWLAILEQRKTGELLGAILVLHGWVTRGQIESVMQSE